MVLIGAGELQPKPCELACTEPQDGNRMIWCLGPEHSLQLVRKEEIMKIISKTPQCIVPNYKHNTVFKTRQESEPGEGNGSPLQHSCLEDSKDGGAWWAIVHRIAQKQTWLKLSSSSSSEREQISSAENEMPMSENSDEHSRMSIIYGLPFTFCLHHKQT